LLRPETSGSPRYRGGIPSSHGSWCEPWCAGSLGAMTGRAGWTGRPADCRAGNGPEAVMGTDTRRFARCPGFGGDQPVRTTVPVAFVPTGGGPR